MHKELLASSIAEHITFSYTCSGGNGGQNVNKVQTKVHAFIQLNTLNGLSSAEMQQLRRNLAGKITGAGTIHVTVQEQRSREQNRITALARMEQLIVTAARLPAKRKKTSVPRGIKERRLNAKKLHAKTKLNRQFKLTPYEE